MARELEPVKVTADTTLTDVLALARRDAVVLDDNGVRYRLTREMEDSWADYDPAKVGAALGAFGGSWSDVDADAVIADIYRAREEGSRPVDRPFGPGS
jgi:hypothetical protein